ncbi:uncharacterized protein LOC143143730 isoform X2 [Ptiloglossa arizonensis]|uniref:uncharacterized protein LOC143143730 isoform X2 n=1 Tax=Ptiloglossa arizonensis TaxID=3350558 RepID=UPI003FA0230E
MECRSVCAICGIDAIHKCSACENVYYCSRQHQKEDWKKHTEVCKPYKLMENSTLGRHYVATRNIKIGEIVLTDDQPLVAGPMHNSVPVCLRCYTMLYKTTAVPCMKCGWPLCQDCKDHGLECDFTSSRRDNKVNGHEVPLTNPSYIAVYELASLLEHACKPNCSKSFTNKGGLIIHAATHITKGNHISICYTDPLWGTTNRRHHLSETKFFECTCDRCKDPTEFGTMFNATKCNKIDCSGYMLPKTFLCQEEKDYICSMCSSTVLYETVEEILENIGIDFSRMKKNDIIACKAFLDHYKTVLHPNHFYNTDVNIALAQLIGQQSGGLQAVEEDLLVMKIELCKKLDNLLQILAPAENRIRGLILFELHAALADFSRRHTAKDTLILLLESKKCSVEAYRLLKFEPTVLPEGKIALQAKENLQKTNKILKHFNLKSKDST